MVFYGRRQCQLAEEPNTQIRQTCIDDLIRLNLSRFIHLGCIEGLVRMFNKYAYVQVSSGVVFVSVLFLY